MGRAKLSQLPECVIHGHLDVATDSRDAPCCVSCGRPMDLDVYFTMCPHCGFNYRIRVSHSRRDKGVELETLLMALMVAIAMVGVGYLLLLSLVV